MLKKILPSLALMAVGAQASDIYVFSESADTSAWQVVNDGVMGGLSNGSLAKNGAGHGVFSGTVSLDNYGGFTSIRYRMAGFTIHEKKTIAIRLKGDGKKYQFRVKTNANDRHSYIGYFTTDGSWQTIEVTLADLYPQFRGRQLDMPNFNDNHIGEIGILIGNKKADSFNLIIDYIKLK